MSKLSNPVLIGCKPNLVHNDMQTYPSSLDNRSVAVNICANNELEARNRRNVPEGLQEQDLAVCVDNLYKSYDKGRPVLGNLCMNVQRGTIYGLLGSSGCGKTTLLSCIVGLKDWDSGEISVFGHRPGTKESGIPGKRLGYMPQDLAIYDQLSIREILTFYGRLFGMSSEDVTEQWRFLADFLKLPTKFKLIKDLSGGQRRRVSLALTLVHSPELLILDEPTVGLDPLLRESIWEHLFKMVQTRQTTVIITTHYIEEARFSNKIGIIRKGHILVEDAPNVLLQQYDCELLEQVVLKLCRKDDQFSPRSSDSSTNGKLQSATRKRSNKRHRSINNANLLVTEEAGGKSKNSYNVYEKFQENWEPSPQRKMSTVKCDNDKSSGRRACEIFQRIRALSTVMWLMFMRHPVFLVMVLALPTLQMFLTLAVLGTEPKGFRIGVVNDDLAEPGQACLPKSNISHLTTVESGVGYMESCDFTLLSCKLIAQFTKADSMLIIPMQSVEQAVDAIHKGELWGYFLFPANYSEHLAALITEHKFAGNETIEGSRVRLTLDKSHYLAAALVTKQAFEAYEEFVKNLAITCGLDPREFQLPFMYREPVYGHNGVSYHEYATPIIILTVIFEIPMLLTAVLFINDRKQGTLDRARVAGLKFKEIMLSYFLTQGSLIVGQSVICFLVMKYIYGFQILGSFCLYFLICILGGLCGESSGLLLGVLFQEEVEALMFGIFLGPILLLYEGALWPVEGQQLWPWRMIAYSLPTTFTIESLRSTVYRGLGILHPFVYNGIGVISLWTAFFSIISIMMYIRKYK